MKCGKCEYDTDKINWGSSVDVQQMVLGRHRKDCCSHEDYVEEENCQDGEFLCIDNDRGRALFTKDIYPSPSRYCDICYAYWEKLGCPWMIPGEVKFTTNPKGKELGAVKVKFPQPEIDQDQPLEVWETFLTQWKEYKKQMQVSIDNVAGQLI